MAPLATAADGFDQFDLDRTAERRGEDDDDRVRRRFPESTENKAKVGDLPWQTSRERRQGYC
jgi:hypothetical protein